MAPKTNVLQSQARNCNRGNPRVDPPDKSSPMVEIAMVEDVPQAYFVPIERQRSPHFFLKIDPSTRQEIDMPMAIQIGKVSPRGSHETFPHFVGEFPALDTFVSLTPVPTVAFL